MAHYFSDFANAEYVIDRRVNVRMASGLCDPGGFTIV